ncbi:MAG: Fur family transcriptional regulator Irr [Xanthobacteraceae bacterium]
MSKIPGVDTSQHASASHGRGLAAEFVVAREWSETFQTDWEQLLREAGLKLTRQRRVLGRLLFAKGGRHVTAEMLHAEATEARIHISLGTIYNTLNQFRDAGLLRQIGVGGMKSFFDTNPTCHHHFFVAQEDRMFDVPGSGVVMGKIPQPPAGFEIAGIDVMVHLRRKPD